MAKIRLVLSLVLLGALGGFVARNMGSQELDLVATKMSFPLGFVALGGAAVGAVVTFLVLVMKGEKKDH
jgi:uncharacterized integral membrane protein